MCRKTAITIRAFAASTLAVALLLSSLMATSAYAEHETRTQVLQDTGLNVVLVALVIGAAVMLFGLFAGVMLWLDRQDEEAERQAQRHD
jgi:ABC-type enterobactin transport system permease subunit